MSRIVCEDAEAEGTREGGEGGRGGGEKVVRRTRQRAESVRDGVWGVMRGCGGVLWGRVAGDAGQGRVSSRHAQKTGTEARGEGEQPGPRRRSRTLRMQAQLALTLPLPVEVGGVPVGLAVGGRWPSFRVLLSPPPKESRSSSSPPLPPSHLPAWTWTISRMVAGRWVVRWVGAVGGWVWVCGRV